MEIFPIKERLRRPVRGRMDPICKELRMGVKDVQGKKLLFPDHLALFDDFPDVVDAEMVGEVAVVRDVQDD